ncbi:MAG: elongation factor G [Lentisphaerae bacterium]|jgi:elongation factor G|nr:elongation factor G [Lentisphaerota bacterium]
MSSLEKIRNLSIIAHIDAGKTSTTEGLLFHSGLSHRYGNIDDGTTTMDFLPDERARGITIAAAAATIPWKDYEFHLIDTPGHIDFTAEVERSLRAIEGAVVIFSAVEGVEAQSEKVWRQADKYHVAKIAFINKMDRIGASFEQVIAQINAKFSDCALPMQLPVGRESEFSAIIDILEGELIRLSGEHGEQIERSPLDENQQKLRQEAFEKLIEKVGNFSDEIAMHYLEGEIPSRELLQKEIRRLTIERKLVPVFLGSAKRNIGIQMLADAVIDYLPSPLDVPPYKAFEVRNDNEIEVHPDSKEPFSGFIFKINASSTADLFFIRIYSGTITPNMMLANSRTRDKVRTKQLYKIYAKNTELIESAGPGDIVGLTGLKDCGIGDTLCDPKRLIAFEKISFPEPVISMVVEPKFSKDKDKLDEALNLLCREDQTLKRSTAEDTGQRLVSGMGELHLEVSLKRVSTDFGVEIRMGEPRVAYRETLTDAVKTHVVFNKVLGDTTLYAEISIDFSPMPRDGDPFLIKNSTRDNTIPKNLIASAEQALNDGLRTGGLKGYPMIYVAAEIRELKYSTENTTPGAVAGAALEAIDQALHNVGTILLEPLMNLEILTPEDTVGEISMYLQPRRALIRDIEQIGSIRKILCDVPLAEMFGFGKALPRLSGGRGSFSLEPSGYQEIDDNTQLKGY